MVNVGLANVPPPLDHGVLDQFQGLPQIEGVNRVGKGWNEFVLYGDVTAENSFEVFPEYYYFYVGMTWDDGEGRVLTQENAGKGIFFRNFIDYSVEGFYCYRDNLAYHNWLCESNSISAFNWDPEVTRMPLNREHNSRWTCGVEDRNTYTQAQCK